MFYYSTTDDTWIDVFDLEDREISLRQDRIISLRELDDEMTEIRTQEGVYSVKHPIAEIRQTMGFKATK